MSKNLIKTVIPWVITAIALFIAFRAVEWSVLWEHFRSVDLSWVALAVTLTLSSYLLRAFRWQQLFPEREINYADSARVLILGFFMNNILPARTGELVRAHIGGRVTKLKRTLVLATIASERLADGLTLSLFFVAVAASSSNDLGGTSQSLLWVAGLFFVVTAGVVGVLSLRKRIFALISSLSERFQGKLSNYTLSRVETFIYGLEPLVTATRLPLLVLWSIVIWVVELLVYVCICNAFQVDTSLTLAVIFLVTVNFSSLIPAAPGGIGVIEAVTAGVLVSLGIDREQALAMVIMQHSIQYIVVGIPGAALMLTWRKMIPARDDIEMEPVI